MVRLELDAGAPFRGSAVGKWEIVFHFSAFGPAEKQAAQLASEGDHALICRARAPKNAVSRGPAAASPLHLPSAKYGMNVDSSLDPELSVVVSTFNRAAHLERALRALLRQDVDRRRFEIVVVDNNSTDDTPEVVRRLQQGASNIRYELETAPGVSNGRNRGICVTRTPIVAITDDDVEVAADWLRRILECFSLNPHAAFVGGVVRPRWRSAPPRWIVPALDGPLGIVDYGDDPLTVGSERRLCLLTGNFAVRREALDRVGFFAPEFRRCQDHELQLRMWQAGLVGIYDPMLTACTDVPPERLRKSYHRMWYRRNGAYHALMPSEAMCDRPLAAEEKVVCLWGVPAFVFRQLVRRFFGAVTSYVAGREALALTHETRVWYFVAYIRARVARYRRSTDTGMAANLWRFWCALARNKMRAGRRDAGADRRSCPPGTGAVAPPGLQI
jgi:glycosyltransferase involved in cell wall biosynthesis